MWKKTNDSDPLKIEGAGGVDFDGVNFFIQ